MNKRIVVFFCALFALVVTASASGDSGEEAAIHAVLNQQVNAWNSGNLEAFMETYWKSEDLTYFSGGTPRNGWKSTLERYIKTYQSEESEMGYLTFRSIDVEILGPESALVKGEWFLKREKLDDIGGLFTLILKKFPDGWKIIHDHSSSSQ